MIRHIPRAQISGDVEPASTGPAARRPALVPELPQGAQRAALARALTLLLSEELRLAPAQIEHVLSRELLRVRRASQVVVRLHPEDLALLEQTEHYTRALELLGSLAFEADPALTRGGCLLSSNLGEIDASLETRLTLVLTLLERGTLV